MWNNLPSRGKSASPCWALQELTARHQANFVNLPHENEMFPLPLKWLEGKGCLRMGLYVPNVLFLAPAGTCSLRWAAACLFGTEMCSSCHWGCPKEAHGGKVVWWCMWAWWQAWDVASEVSPKARVGPCRGKSQREKRHNCIICWNYFVLRVHIFATVSSFLKAQMIDLRSLWEFLDWFQYAFS